MSHERMAEAGARVEAAAVASAVTIALTSKATSGWSRSRWACMTAIRSSSVRPNEIDRS